MTRTKTKQSAAQAVKKAHAASSPAKAGGRLGRGALDGLVLDYMAGHADDGPFGPGMIAKGLERSAGAVSNGLVRLTRAKKGAPGQRPPPPLPDRVLTAQTPCEPPRASLPASNGGAGAAPRHIQEK